MNPIVWMLGNPAVLIVLSLAAIGFIAAILFCIGSVIGGECVRCGGFLVEIGKGHYQCQRCGRMYRDEVKQA